MKSPTKINKAAHLFQCLGEEGCEIAQDCSKIIRFGLHDTNVLNPTGPNNQQRLINELNDLLGVVIMLVESGLLPDNWADGQKRRDKVAKVKKFLRYAKKHGALKP